MPITLRCASIAMGSFIRHDALGSRGIQSEETMQVHNESQLPIKDEDAAHPVASVWRPVLEGVIRAFTQGDFTIARGSGAVAPISATKAARIASNLANYGETLTDLPAEAWATSVSQWMETHWDVLVDLWTVESGASDLVLSARVYEADEGFRFEVDSVHVP